MPFTAISGGFELSKDDRKIVNSQRAITKVVNEQFIQVGAVFLKASGKRPVDEDWANKAFRDTDLQAWIDDPKHILSNVGFNLQFGWMDVDIDAQDPEYNDCLLRALDYCGVDTRFRFGRRSVGYPTHVLVQLGEEEASSFEVLSKFEPKEFRLGDKRYHTQLRSYPTNISDNKNAAKAAKQTVVPGSVYLHKENEGTYDLSVWYAGKGIAGNAAQLAQTTPRRVGFNSVLRAIAFGTFLYLVRPHWTSGSRQTTAVKVAGWLARIVRDSEAINHHETLSLEVFCPVDSDSMAEALLSFVCDTLGDDEKHMRIRTYEDAREKLNRNADAKIPGWPAITQLLGAQSVVALRTVFTPGSDVSVLTKLVERYLYDETDGLYIDRNRHRSGHEIYSHEAAVLERRHTDEVVLVKGKPHKAFKMYETSQLRVRVGRRDLYPDQPPGNVFRINKRGSFVPDDDPDDDAYTVFNTWRGFPIAPAVTVDPILMEQIVGYLDKLLGFLTCDSVERAEWLKDWVAWILQHPDKKQQIAPVIVGGQGVGKSFFGNDFLSAIFGYTWGTSSAAIIDDKFNIGPFVGKMVVFIDEVKFHNESGTNEIKKLIRNVNVPGMLKYGEGQNFHIYSRMVFASNDLDMAIGQRSVLDRALFYIRSYSAAFKKMTEAEFNAWAETLKPWFEEFSQLLSRIDVREHYVRYFMDRPVTKESIESIRHSAGADADIIEANMRPSRRFAKLIIEEGRIFDDLSIERPFGTAELGNRIREMAETLNTKPIRTDLVMAEWMNAGIVEKRGFQFVFKYRHATLLEKFGAAISMELDQRYEFSDADRGLNDEPDKRRPWRGGAAKGMPRY